MGRGRGLRGRVGGEGRVVYKISGVRLDIPRYFSRGRRDVFDIQHHTLDYLREAGRDRDNEVSRGERGVRESAFSDRGNVRGGGRRGGIASRDLRRANAPFGLRARAFFIPCREPSAVFYPLLAVGARRRLHRRHRKFHLAREVFKGMKLAAILFLSLVFIPVAVASDGKKPDMAAQEKKLEDVKKKIEEIEKANKAIKKSREELKKIDSSIVALGGEVSVAEVKVAGLTAEKRLIGGRLKSRLTAIYRMRNGGVLG